MMETQFYKHFFTIVYTKPNLFNLLGEGVASYPWYTIHNNTGLEVHLDGNRTRTSYFDYYDSIAML